MSLRPSLGSFDNRIINLPFIEKSFKAFNRFFFKS